MKKNYGRDELIRVAKRENNNKRSYLYVDPLQGKHIPVSPGRSLEMFSVLADILMQHYAGERLLVTGFAETATAIGSAISCRAENVYYYLNTTREDIDGAEYLYFTESHSHATEQRLVMNGLDTAVDDVDRIIFAEDEVTTGNTIEKLIRLLEERYTGRKLKFGIISILNSMTEERLKELDAQGIACDCLQRIPAMYRCEETEKHTYLPLRKEPAMQMKTEPALVRVPGRWNCRIVKDTASIRASVEAFVSGLINKLDGGRACSLESTKGPHGSVENAEGPCGRIKNIADPSVSTENTEGPCGSFENNGCSAWKSLEKASGILILGTEEFMFPGMLLGAKIEKLWPDKKVRFHATTRSPIEISADEDYPLHNRTPLESLYGKDRRTYIYNFEKYDKVLILTDAPSLNREGLVSLAGALEEYGNDDITLIQWEDGECIHAEQLFKG